MHTLLLIPQADTLLWMDRQRTSESRISEDNDHMTDEVFKLISFAIDRR